MQVLSRLCFVILRAVLPDNILRRLTQIPGVRSLWRRFPVGAPPLRARYGIYERPHYAYGVCAAAELAKRLGLPAITALEFGVAGGNGLLALEDVALEIGGYFGVEISVFGFDSGAGMPAPVDYRDLPYVWDRGFYQMDQTALGNRLKRARLVIGDVADSVQTFLATPGLAPIGFAAFDLDYYSSTKKAFAIFESRAELRLPRLFCYFDDIIWPEFACYNEYTGELGAIREFNLEHEDRKVCPVHMLRHLLPHSAPWQDQMYVLHDFHHPLYNVNLMDKGERARQLNLTP